MSKRRKQAGSRVRLRFKVGDPVRVKAGFRDEEHPDLPMGGWAGTISVIHKNGMLSVRWSRETLASIHPIYKKRCLIEDLEYDEFWFEEDELTPDLGGPLSIEQPTAITPCPLTANDPGDRVRKIFGLTSDDFLPESDEDSLETYYDFLAKELSLPFEARHRPEMMRFVRSAPMRRVEVVALDREAAWNDDEGVLCRVRSSEGEDVLPLAQMSLNSTDPNYQLVGDYLAWFFGELSVDVDEEDEEDEEDFDEEDEDDDAEEFDDEDAEESADGPAFEVADLITQRGIPRVALEFIVFLVCVGAVVGSAVAAMPWAKWGAWIGIGLAVVLGVLVPTLRPRMNAGVPPLGSVNFVRFFPKLAGFVFVGTYLGILVAGFIGAVPGGVVGFGLRRLGIGRTWPKLCFFSDGVLCAAACGVVVEAFYINHTAAANGLRLGSLIALGIALFISLVVMPIAQFVLVRALRSQVE